MGIFFFFHPAAAPFKNRSPVAHTHLRQQLGTRSTKHSKKTLSQPWLLPVGLQPLSQSFSPPNILSLSFPILKKWWTSNSGGNVCRAAELPAAKLKFPAERTIFEFVPLRCQKGGEAQLVYFSNATLWRWQWPTVRRSPIMRLKSCKFWLERRRGLCQRLTSRPQSV